MTRLRDDSRIAGWPDDRMSTNHVSHCTTSSECFLGTWWRDLLWTFSDSLTDQWSLTVPWFGQSRDTLVLAERFAERCDRCDMFVIARWPWILTMMTTMVLITMMMIDSMLCLWCSIHLVGLGSCLPTPHQPQSVIQSRPIAIISEIFSPAWIFRKYFPLLKPRFDNTNM